MRRSCTAGRGGGQRAGSGYNGGAPQQQRQPQYDDPFASFWGAYGGNPYGNAGYGGYGQTRQDDSIEMRAAKNYIDTGHYAEALNALGSVPPGKRNARWYFLKRAGAEAACTTTRRPWNTRQTGREHGTGQHAVSAASQPASGRRKLVQPAGTGIRPQNRQHEQRLHDHPDAEPVLRLLRRRSDDVLSDVLLHLSGLKENIAETQENPLDFLHSAMKSAIIKARRKGFCGLALCGLARW